MKYNPKNTAIKRNTLSKPMQKLLDLGIFQGGNIAEKKILDYGCGKGYDVLTMRYNGFDINGYDKYNLDFDDKELLVRTYDIVTYNYVFNVVKSLEEHEEALKLLKILGKEVYISVRADSKSIKDNWLYDEEDDRWDIGKSYQRFYNEQMIEKYFGEVEYIINNSSTKLFRLK